MVAYKYLGLSEANKSEMRDSAMARIVYPEDRARKLHYYDDAKDSMAMMEEKKKRRKEFDKGVLKDWEADIKDLDVEFHLGDYCFPKGKFVEIDPMAKHIIAKLESLVLAGKVVEGEKQPEQHSQQNKGGK